MTLLKTTAEQRAKMRKIAEANLGIPTAGLGAERRLVEVETITLALLDDIDTLLGVLGAFYAYDKESDLTGSVWEELEPRIRALLPTPPGSE